MRKLTIFIIITLVIKFNLSAFSQVSSCCELVSAIIDNNTHNFSFVYKTNAFSMDSSICYSWDTISGSYKLISKRIYEYDSNGNQIFFLIQSWKDSLSAWVNIRQGTYTYNSNGNKENYLIETWSGNAWSYNEYQSFIYDSNGFQTGLLRQSWNGSSWENFEMRTYTDSAGYRMSELTQYWDGTNWKNSISGNFTYDSAGNYILGIYLDWNSFTSSWVNYFRDFISYDNNGNTTLWLRHGWENNTWENLFQFTYSYDNDGNLTGLLKQLWDGTFWIFNGQTNYYYDANGNMIGSATNGTIEGFNDSCSYYYSELNYLALTNPIDKDIKLFPNPSNSKISFSHNFPHASIQIFNILGENVYSGKFEKELDVSFLTEGIYIIDVASKENTYRTKFVKE